MNTAIVAYPPGYKGAFLIRAIGDSVGHGQPDYTKVNVAGRLLPRIPDTKE